MSNVACPYNRALDVASSLYIIGATQHLRAGVKQKGISHLKTDPNGPKSLSD
jgi:hypothetical protein